MKRIHLFEFEDQSWFPGFLRNYMTDFLQHLTRISKLFHPSIPVMEELLRESGESRILDLGSGSGGGILSISDGLRRVFPALRITLSDLYPNTRAFKNSVNKAEGIDYLNRAVDARNVDPGLEGVRTQFLSLHHFTESEALEILENAVLAQRPIGIFEGQERSLASVLAMLFSPVSVLLLTPFIRPFSAGRLFFTYLLPLVPIFVLWDGVVSSLRTYSVKEMEVLISGVEGKDRYIWKAGRLRSGPAVNLYLIGYPRKK